MSDDQPTLTAQYNTKIWAAGIGAGFAFSVIVFLLLAGHAGNELHRIAMTWAWITVIGVLAGFGIGAAIGPIADVWKR